MNIAKKDQINAVLEHTTAALDLLEGVICPLFSGVTLEGALKDYREKTGKDEGQAALAWMVEKYTALSASCNACLCLVKEAWELMYDGEALDEN